jgi:hypothetical protein
MAGFAIIGWVWLVGVKFYPTTTTTTNFDLLLLFDSSLSKVFEC